ncbi:cytochrome c [Alteraurantiacibacter buctensis]|uniref:Cytochrome c n=1 Tax=Alteraurantiacibacter buctensis TaxID=1503981 RepID=A0A844YT46_9SPHN|nr:cytochrome c [Alteraurantiacibacter buctensis]MXO70272.1 hypothetical protein [Alteraurantiacibacter buctensis]
MITVAGSCAAVLLLASCADEPADLPYGTVQQMMANEVQPTADIYWGAVGSSSELIDGKPVNRDWQPETDAEWQAVAASAVKLRELANTLGSPAYAEVRAEGWTDFTEGLAQAATRAEEAAKSKNPDAVFEAGGTLYSVCSACHQAFPPEAPAAGAEPVDMTPNR